MHVIIEYKYKYIEYLNVIWEKRFIIASKQTHFLKSLMSVVTKKNVSL